MALDTTVMNTAIATVAKDLGTTVAGIQTAITLYTLVMASLMITGGKVGEILGRKRAFSIGCVVYACGSFTTSLAPNLTVLIIGWSFLEGLGAVLIMPAIVALVASNFGQARAPARVRARRRRRRHRRGARAGDRRRVHHLRLVALGVRRRGADRPGHPAAGPPGERQAGRGGRAARPGRHGAVRARPRPRSCSASCARGTWGFVQPKPEAPEWLGLSPVIWLVLGGGVVLALFLWWESRRLARGEGALIDPTLLRNLQLRSGVISFLFMFLVQAGIFFVVPLFLSVALGCRRSIPACACFPSR